MELPREVLEGAGRAGRCDLARYHRPVPLRHVWLLVQPAECGGDIRPDNLVPVCDSCWWACRLLLRQLAHGGLLPGASRAHLAVARRGYQACLAAGTADRIPAEW